MGKAQNACAGCKSSKVTREGSVMVVGGGVAGLQTAMDLTDLGFYVYLVE